MLVFTLVLTVLSILFRHPIAEAVGVKKDSWAAAIGLPAGCLWLELSILRGALQGVGDYKSVGISLVAEQATRLVVGATLAASRPRRHRRVPRHAAVVPRHVRATARCGCASTRPRAPERPSRSPSPGRRAGSRSGCGRTSSTRGRRSPGWS